MSEEIDNTWGEVFRGNLNPMERREVILGHPAVVSLRRLLVRGGAVRGAKL